MFLCVDTLRSVVFRGVRTSNKNWVLVTILRVKTIKCLRADTKHNWRKHNSLSRNYIVTRLQKTKYMHIYSTNCCQVGHLKCPLASGMHLFKVLVFIASFSLHLRSTSSLWYDDQGCSCRQDFGNHFPFTKLLK